MIFCHCVHRADHPLELTSTCPKKLRRSNLKWRYFAERRCACCGCPPQALPPVRLIRSDRHRPDPSSAQRSRHSLVRASHRGLRSLTPLYGDQRRSAGTADAVNGRLDVAIQTRTANHPGNSTSSPSIKLGEAAQHMARLQQSIFMPNAIMTLKSELSLGDCWAGNTANCIPYRVSPMLTSNDVRIVAFYNGQGHIKILRYDIANSKISEFTIPNDRQPLDGHQAISIGQDRSGRLHLAFGAHSSNILLSSSKSAHFEDGFAETREHFSTGTYPMYLRWPSGKLVLLFRSGVHYSGSLRFAELDEDTCQWIEQTKPVISGEYGQYTAGPYLNTPVFSADGRLHLFIVWRLPGNATSAGQVVNVGLDHLYSDDEFNTFYSYNGVRLSKPVNLLNSPRVIAVPIGSSLINQSTANVLSNGNPVALTYWEEGDGIPQYKLCWHDRKTWRVATVSNFKTPFRLDGGGTLPLPHSRPEFVVDDSDNVIIIYRSIEKNGQLLIQKLFAPNYRLSDSFTQILVKENLGFYEPVIDRSAWSESGELVIFVQFCQQGLNMDGRSEIYTSEARLMTWTYDQSFSRRKQKRSGLKIDRR